MYLSDIVDRCVTERMYIAQNIYDKEYTNEHGQKCIQCHDEGKFYYQDEIPSSILSFRVSVIGVKYDKSNDDFCICVYLCEHHKHLFK